MIDIARRFGSGDVKKRAERGRAAFGIGVVHLDVPDVEQDNTSTPRAPARWLSIS